MPQQNDNVVTTNTDSTNYVDIWHEVAAGVNSGAYAVLLAIAVVYVMTRRAVGRAWCHHFEMLELLRKTTERNSDSIRVFSETQRKVADYLITLDGEPSPTKLLSMTNDNLTPINTEDDKKE